MLTEMASKIYPMESIVCKTAKMINDKKDLSQEAAIEKLFCSEAIVEICGQSSSDKWWNWLQQRITFRKFYRDARILKIFEGTNEIQKMIIGKNVIKSNGKWTN